MCYQSFLEYRNSSSVTMERSRNGTLMRLNSQDFESLERVEELYFGERETEENQEPENFFLEESSSESDNEKELMYRDGRS